MKVAVNSCAIYTRKSTEEGLDQDFNSLDAQRESCLSFIASQKAEGWTALPDLYDDGGFTGGNMNRPALQRLINDIKSGKVKTVVVYKIDRLTRSLMDFSKLVDLFEKHGVSFVSVTQAFNTTTSMGRLTLNVLLSFAQFEREVIGERVRDKIAASKKKGMWMGGPCPVGYSNIDRHLVPNPEEMEFVKMIYERYLIIGSVRQLRRELKAEGVKSPIRESKKGHHHGGLAYSRGALYAILRNPVYVGKTRHKNQIYDGQHPGIIDQNLWDKVQKQLNDNLDSYSSRERQNMLLQGLIHDEQGSLYTTIYAQNADGRRYRYYVNTRVTEEKEYKSNTLTRIPAAEIEDVVTKCVLELFDLPEQTALLTGIDMIENIESLAKIRDHKSKLDIESSFVKPFVKLLFVQTD